MQTTTSDKVQYFPFPHANHPNFEHNQQRMRRYFQVAFPQLLDLVKLADALFHLNLANQETLSSSSFKTFPPKNYTVLLREIARIIDADSSDHFASSTLFEEELSDEQSAARQALADHGPAI